MEPLGLLGLMGCLAWMAWMVLLGLRACLDRLDRLVIRVRLALLARPESRVCRALLVPTVLLERRVLLARMRTLLWSLRRSRRTSR